jgi:hypothetical protein
LISHTVVGIVWASRSIYSVEYLAKRVTFQSKPLCASVCALVRVFCSGRIEKGYMILYSWYTHKGKTRWIDRLLRHDS